MFDRLTPQAQRTHPPSVRLAVVIVAAGALLLAALLLAAAPARAQDTLPPADPPAEPSADVHVLAADAQFVVALESMRLRAGPGTSFSIIGGVAPGRTAQTTGMSLDRGWWRVLCPDGSAGSCWISADPQLTKPVALYDAGAPWHSYESA